MRKLLLSVTAFVLVFSSTFAEEPTVILKHAVTPEIVRDKVKDERKDDVVEQFRKMYGRSRYPGPLPSAIGEPILWMVRNADKWRGWSLTGYSWGGLTSDFNPWRFKVGVVNGEWELAHYEFMAENREWANFADWERQTGDNSEAVFGVSFTVIF